MKKFFESNKTFFKIAWSNHKIYFLNYILKTILNSMVVLIWVKLPQLFLSSIINDENFHKALVYIVLATTFSAMWTCVERMIVLCQNKITREISLKLKENIYAKIVNNDSTAFEDNAYYDKMNRALNYTEEAGDTLMSIASSVISTIISLIGVGYILAKVNLLIILILTLTSIISHLFIKKTNTMWFKFQQNERLPAVRFIRYLNSIFTNKKMVDEIKLYDAFKFVKKTIERETMSFTSYEIKKDSERFKYNYIAILINGLQKMSCYIYFGYLLFNGSIDVALYSTLFAATTQFVECANEFLNRSIDLKNKASEAEYYNQFVKSPEYEYFGKKDIGDVFKSIKFQNVTFSYPGKEDCAIKNITFEIHPGEKIAIVGENGSGKTTLVKLLMGLYPPSGGKIWINDMGIEDINIKRWQEKISVSFQQPVWFPLSIEKNITLNDKTCVNLYDAIDRVGLRNVIQNLPKKEKTKISKEFDQDGVDFSGGELQRISLSRAYYKNGTIFVFDEPSSALDPNAEYNLWQDLLQIGYDKTVVFISHRLSMTINADRIILLDGGEIKEMGSHNELMKLRGQYYNMFQKQASNYIES